MLTHTHTASHRNASSTFPRQRRTLNPPHFQSVHVRLLCVRARPWLVTCHWLTLTLAWGLPQLQASQRGPASSPGPWGRPLAPARKLNSGVSVGFLTWRLIISWNTFQCFLSTVAPLPWILCMNIQPLFLFTFRHLCVSVRLHKAVYRCFVKPVVSQR